MHMEAVNERVSSGERQVWVDNLRVLVIAGVVVLHSATAYLGGADWYYMERTTSNLWATLLAFPATAGALFGLAPLFLIAGWYSAVSLVRHGPGRFARGRALRLGLPLAAYVLLIDPLASSIGRWGMARPAGLWRGGLEGLEAGPMWFVGALLVFSVAYGALRQLRPARASHGRLGTGDLIGGLCVLVAASWLAWQWWPLADGDTLLNLRWGLWPQGAVLFALGVRAGEAHAADAPSWPAARRLGWLALGSVAGLFTLAAIEIARDQVAALGSGHGWETALLAVFYGVISLTWSVWLMAWARRRWVWQSPLLTRAGRASYAAYILHPVVLTSVMVLGAAVPLVPEVKFLLVSVVAVPTCFGVGHLIARTPGVSRIV